MGKNKKKSSSYRRNTRVRLDKRNVGFKKSRRNDYGYEPSAGIPNGAETVYRILCPTKKIGGVIGKGGDIIKAMRDETHAKIKVDEAVPGTDERVVIIFSSSTKTPRASSADEDLETDASDEKEHEPMQPHCPAQHALLKVHERIVEEEDLYGASDHEDDKESNVVTARLLVPSNQVGCLLGKGGHVIQKLRSETGANIRILPPEHLPACAMSSDELVQISGASDVAKKALYEVSTLLYQNPRPPMNHPEPAGGPGFYPPGPPMRNMLPPGNPMWSHRNSGFHGPPSMPWGGGFGNEFLRFGPGGFNGGPAGNSGKASAEFNMKILCPADKIGVVIGKGGSNVKQIQQETGANIHVEDSTGEADERVILVSCFDAPWNPRSPTIDAILQLQVHTHEISEKGTITTRLLVPSNKVGCLLGQGGHIITEMRRRCQADIRVISKDGKPTCASADEELVQISGNVNVARNALTEIASRLRVRSLEGVQAEPGPMGPFQGFGPSEGFHDRGLPPPGMLGPGSSGGYEHSKGGIREFEPKSYPVQPSGTGPAGYPNLNSSMEVKIPNTAINAVLGAGGSNISSIGQLTGAKVKLNDPQAGVSECIVEIHGSSDQMIAAQNLLHNFIASAAHNYNAQPQPAPPAPAVQSYNTQQQQSPYATGAAQNYSSQYQQQSAYSSSAPNYGAQQQQHTSPYASAVQSYGAQQQQSPYASAAHNYDNQQQHTHYAGAVQTYDTQHLQQQQQQQRTYSSAAVMYETQQQQGPYQY